MTYHSRISAEEKARDEAPFEIEELFFSRTDKRGVIAAGNEVFQRISGFEWQELIGAPHKIIRHSDMPKGVFHLLWERIQRGKTTGAYVKNSDKSGRYYWVYAVISPIDGGYLSVRMKPCSKNLAKIKDIYAQLVRYEQEDGATPEQSAAKLRSILTDMDFPNYLSFSAFSLAEEMISREKAMEFSGDQRLQKLQDILPALRELEAEQEKLVKAFALIRGIPSNMRIVASRLEPAGGPISAISQNYRLMAEDVTMQLSKMQSAEGDGADNRAIRDRVFQSLFLVGAARLQREVQEDIESNMNRHMGDVDLSHEMEYLSELTDRYALHSGENLNSMCAELTNMGAAAASLRQLVTGLDSIRVLCRVEAGRLGSASGALMPVIDQLDNAHVTIEKSLERILETAETVKQLGIDAMPRSLNGQLRQKHRRFHKTPEAQK